MYCPSCAAPIENTKFCRSCGANVSLIPQALSGQLPQAEPANDRHGRGGRRRHRGEKELSIEKAASTFFTGFGFIFAALAVMRFFPGGFTWGWSLFIPAFACIGQGVGQYLRLQEQQREQQQFNPPVQYRMPVQPPAQAAGLSAPTTSELITPPSVPQSITEHTTKHLDASTAKEP